MSETITIEQFGELLGALHDIEQQDYPRNQHQEEVKERAETLAAFTPTMKRWEPVLNRCAEAVGLDAKPLHHWLSVAEAACQFANDDPGQMHVDAVGNAMYAWIDVSVFLSWLQNGSAKAMGIVDPRAVSLALWTDTFGELRDTLSADLVTPVRLELIRRIDRLLCGEGIDTPDQLEAKINLHLLLIEQWESNDWSKERAHTKMADPVHDCHRLAHALNLPNIPTEPADVKTTPTAARIALQALRQCCEQAGGKDDAENLRDLLERLLALLRLPKGERKENEIWRLDRLYQQIADASRQCGYAHPPVEIAVENNLEVTRTYKPGGDVYGEVAVGQLFASEYEDWRKSLVSVVQWWCDEVSPLDAFPPSTPQPAGGADRQDVPLNQRQQWVLQALAEKQIFVSDDRMTTEAIVDRIDKGADPVAYKPVMRELKRLGFIDTLQGGGGGCWLTSKGRQRAETMVR